MDADKEGFLRSDRSLIQTIGRAARNVNGRAILYADRITDSMRRAMDETDRRRNKQIAFNEDNGITPTTIKKRIDDVMEGAHRETPGSRGRKAKDKAAKSTSETLMPKNPQTLTPQQLAKEITRLEDEMFQAAKSLEFERAAAIRDAVAELQSLAFK
jgi:excinuclease ABC subunit B